MEMKAEQCTDNVYKSRNNLNVRMEPKSQGVDTFICSKDKSALKYIIQQHIALPLIRPLKTKSQIIMFD